MHTQRIYGRRIDRRPSGRAVSRQVKCSKILLTYYCKASTCMMNGVVACVHASVNACVSFCLLFGAFLNRDVKPENLMFRRRLQRHGSAAAASCSVRQQQQKQQQQQRDEDSVPYGDAADGAAAATASGASSAGESSSTCPPLLSMEEQHELLLIDFDTSVFIEDPLGAPRSSGGPQRRLVGTYGYLAPEVLTSGRYTRASDLWSVGVILYILMTVRLSIYVKYYMHAYLHPS